MRASTDNAAALAADLGRLLQANELSITTAESCTGGLIAAALTDIAGSSGWFHQGIVSYANSAKMGLLGVDKPLLDQHGAVSHEVVCAMAVGAKRSASANVAVAVSGIAGPGGGTPDKPVGTVWIAWDIDGLGVQSAQFLLHGNRVSIREAALCESLRGTISRLKSVLNED